MGPVHALSVLLVALVPFGWTVAVVLSRLSDTHPDVPTLRSRAIAQIILAIMSTIGGVFAASYLSGFALGGVFIPLLATLTVLPSVPGAWWTYEYLTDGFA